MHFRILDKYPQLFTKPNVLYAGGVVNLYTLLRERWKRGECSLVLKVLRRIRDHEQFKFENRVDAAVLVAQYARTLVSARSRSSALREVTGDSHLFC